MERLGRIADPGCLVFPSRMRDWLALERRGWVAPVKAAVYRITPSGLRALADALEHHGWPPHPEEGNVER
jgi:hypothetical protein